MTMNIQMANTSFEVFSNEASSAYDNSTVTKNSLADLFRRNPKMETTDENGKKTLFGKILKMLSLKVTESKNTEKSRKHCRQRRRSSATPSNVEVMPTIYEDENETADFFNMSASFNPNQGQAIIAVA